MENERRVELRGMTSNEGKDAIKKIKGEEVYSANSLRDAVVKLEPFNCYSFRAEYTFRNDDVVVHFYVPERAHALDTAEARRAWMTYWQTRFPSKLSDVSQEFFKAGPDRLEADYTAEVASWWFRAKGFATATNPKMLVHRFFEKLDEALRQKD